MTLNATDLSSNQDCSSSSTSSNSNQDCKNETINNSTNCEMNKEESNSNNDLMEIDSTNVCSSNDKLTKNEKITTDDVVANLEDDNKISANKSRKKDKEHHLDSPKKRTKLNPRKEEITAKSSSPLIAKPKLQINDKTLKKLRSETDDLIFEDTNNSDHPNDLSNESKTKSNSCLMPVVNNVLSRSIAAIFKNSTINKNGEFNSYSAMGFNKGPRVKRVCRTFSDVYRGLPRAVFPMPSTQTNKINKNSTSSTNSSPSKRNNKTNKKQKNQQPKSTQIASTSNYYKDDLTECSYDSDDLEITEYIARNLKREMESKDISV